MLKTLEGLKKKYILLAGVLLVAALTVFGDKGILDLYKLKRERDGIIVYNKALEKENRQLEEQIMLLEKDKRYIGQIARKELGKLGKNEVVYKIEEPGKDTAQRSGSK